MSYKRVAIKPNTQELFKSCRDLYEKHHPELKEIPLSDNKIFYEICKFYLEN